MTRAITVLLFSLILLVIAGCVSEEGYRAQVASTQMQIEESASLTYAACQENQTRALSSTVVAQKLGKPFITPDAVSRETTQQLEEQWLQLEMKFGSLSSPPSGCEKEYEALQRMHEAYQKLHQLATNPVGPVEQYQFTTDALYEAVMNKSAELTETYAGK